MRLLRIGGLAIPRTLSLLTWFCERTLNIRHNEVDYNNAVEIACPLDGHLGHSATRGWLGASRVIVVAGSRNGAH